MLPDLADFKQLQYAYIVLASALVAVGSTRITFKHWGEWQNESFLFVFSLWLANTTHVGYFFYWIVHNALGAPFGMINHPVIVLIICSISFTTTVNVWIVRDELKYLWGELRSWATGRQPG